MSNEDTPARRPSQPPAENARPRRELTRAELEEQLRRRSASIDGHLEGLQKELTASGEEAKRAARSTTQQYVVPLAAGVGLAGAVLGYWTVRRRRKKGSRARAGAAWRQGEYRDALREEVRAAVERGDDAAKAVTRFFERRGPIVVRERVVPSGAKEKGLIRTVLGLAGRTIVSLAVTYAVGQVAAQLNDGGDEPGELGTVSGNEAASATSAASS